MPNFPTSIDTDASLFLAVNNLRTQLTGAIDASTLTIPVISTTNFPDSGFVTILSGPDITQAEAIRYTSKTATTFIATERGAGSTPALAHGSGNNVDLTVVAAHHNELKDAVIAVENFLGISGSENFVPKDPATGNVVISGTLTLPALTASSDAIAVNSDFDMLGNTIKSAGVVVIQPEPPSVVTSGLLWFDTDESDLIAELPGGITNASGTFTQSLTISGVPVATGTSFSGTRAFFTAPTSGASATVENIVVIEGGIIQSWSQS